MSSEVPPHDELHPVPETDTPIRPYEHLIDDLADRTLFEQTFDARDVDEEDADAVDHCLERPDQTGKTNGESAAAASAVAVKTNNHHAPKTNGLVKKHHPTSSAAAATGLVYYGDNIKHHCLWDDNYEENPRRYTRTFERMNELGLVEQCHNIEPRKATAEELLRVHSQEYVSKIEATSRMVDAEELERESSKYDAVYFNQSTYETALYSTGSVIELVDAVATGAIKNGFALARPPGHHAMESEACGYCFFNNVAVAAEHCLVNRGLKRILILDWDVHHGQATQQKFYRDPRVLYISMHRYEFGAFWPELIESNYNFTGEKSGLGFNMNVPLNTIGCTDADYLGIFHNILLPVLYSFDPELIIVSAGYDAAIGCPEGEMLLTSTFYAHVTHSLMALANGKVAVVLEGGYCLESLADSAALTLSTLLGNAPMNLKLQFPIKQSVLESILDVISVHRQHFWQWLAIQGTFNRHEPADPEADFEIGNFGKRHLPMIEYRGKLDMLPEKPTVFPTRDCYPIQDESVTQKWQSIIESLREQTDAHYATMSECNQTCIIRVPDDVSRRHAYHGTHPERPNRTDFIWKYLKKQAILGRCKVISDNTREAQDDELLLAHSVASLEKVKSSRTMHYKDIREFEKTFDSIYMTQHTDQLARLATGSLLQVVDSVLQGQSRNGAAIIRPPGHHASQDTPAGFCFFNNVAVAARYAISKYGLKRVLILDWDVHHGDGTQNIVKDDPNILFVSLHRFDNATFYPEKSESNFNIAKNVINIPWSGGPMSDKEYLVAFFNIILPCAYNFNPELVLISAGFDAAKGDPLGEYDLSPAVYGHMTHLLSSLANGKIILALEGGYDLKCIASSMAECVKVLLGDAPRRLTSTTHSDTQSPKAEDLNVCAVETMKNVMAYHSSHWPALAFTYDLPRTDDYFYKQ